MSLADVCVERGDDSGGSFRITTEELAERFISYYWRQSAPYHHAGRADTILKQNTGRQAAVISAVMSARATYGGSLARLKADAAVWGRLRRRVAEIIRVMPLWKLQTLGQTRVEFLYAHDLNKGHEVVLKQGVCYCLRLFYGRVHEFARASWLRFVRGVGENRLLLGETADLSDFMFGSRRAPLDVYRPILVEYQSGRCFYCLRPLHDKADVDHFIPWSRYPVDLGHNFVPAHAACNAQKSDRLAAVEHLERWCGRNETHGAELAR